MTSKPHYESLALLLTDWYHSELDDLPEAIRQRVVADYDLITWDMASPKGREQVASQFDFDNDPAHDAAHEFISETAKKRRENIQAIDQWQEVRAETASDLSIKEARLKALKVEEKRLEENLHQFVDGGAKEKSIIGTPAQRQDQAKRAADALHDQPGGSRDKKKQMQEKWASGKYSSRDRCAEEECAALNMSFSAARKALRNTPKPKPHT